MYYCMYPKFANSSRWFDLVVIKIYSLSEWFTAVIGRKYWLYIESPKVETNWLSTIWFCLEGVMIQKSQPPLNGPFIDNHTKSKLWTHSYWPPQPSLVLAYIQLRQLLSGPILPGLQGVGWYYSNLVQSIDRVHKSECKKENWIWYCFRRVIRVQVLHLT